MNLQSEMKVTGINDTILEIFEETGSSVVLNID